MPHAHSHVQKTLTEKVIAPLCRLRLAAALDQLGGGAIGDELANANVKQYLHADGRDPAPGHGQQHVRRGQAGLIWSCAQC